MTCIFVRLAKLLANHVSVFLTSICGLDLCSGCPKTRIANLVPSSFIKAILRGTRKATCGRQTSLRYRTRLVADIPLWHQRRREWIQISPPPGCPRAGSCARLAGLGCVFMLDGRICIAPGTGDGTGRLHHATACRKILTSGGSPHPVVDYL